MKIQYLVGLTLSLLQSYLVQGIVQSRSDKLGVHLVEQIRLAGVLESLAHNLQSEIFRLRQVRTAWSTLIGRGLSRLCSD